MARGIAASRSIVISRAVNVRRPETEVDASATVIASAVVMTPVVTATVLYCRSTSITVTFKVATVIFKVPTTFEAPAAGGMPSSVASTATRIIMAAA